MFNPPDSYHSLCLKCYPNKNQINMYRVVIRTEKNHYCLFFIQLLNLHEAFKVQNARESNEIPFFPTQKLLIVNNSIHEKCVDKNSKSILLRRSSRPVFCCKKFLFIFSQVYTIHVRRINQKHTLSFTSQRQISGSSFCIST